MKNENENIKDRKYSASAFVEVKKRKGKKKRSLSFPPPPCTPPPPKWNYSSTSQRGPRRIPCLVLAQPVLSSVTQRLGVASRSVATFQRNIWKLLASKRLVLLWIESLHSKGVNDGRDESVTTPASLQGAGLFSVRENYDL